MMPAAWGGHVMPHAVTRGGLSFRTAWVIICLVVYLGKLFVSARTTLTVTSIEKLLQQYANDTDAYLDRWLQSLSSMPPQLGKAIRYSLLGPGKRIRPALAMMSSRAVGGTARAALPVAAALELIHCFSLVHDDLPAMDDDDLRRGRPTNHKVFGEGLAILAGDAMNTLAFELLVREVRKPQLAARLVEELAVATGPCGMIGGQVLDTCHPTEKPVRTTAQAGLKKLQTIHRMKTGALITAACRMGAMVGGASQRQLALMWELGQAIGLAFQIVDDLLDVTASASQLGKRAGKDANLGKLTYPSLLGVEKTRRHLAQQQSIAESIVAELGAKADSLRDLVHFLAARGH